MLKLTVSVNFRSIFCLMIDSDFFVMITVVGFAWTTLDFLFCFSKTEVRSISPHCLAWVSSNSLKTVFFGFSASFFSSSVSLGSSVLSAAGLDLSSLRFDVFFYFLRSTFLVDVDDKIYSSVNFVFS